MGDGIVDSQRGLRGTPRAVEAVDQLRHAGARRRATSVISSILFGAIAASGVLPFPRALYEQAITQSGVAVQTNLAGFAAGFERALQALAHRRVSCRRAPRLRPSSAGSSTGGSRPSFRRICTGCCRKASSAAVDYQDGEYANLYLDRLREIRDCDQRTQGAGGGYALTAAVARYLALWMSYEDTIRVADLKTRGTRFSRVRDEVRAQAEQIVYMTEFMHPRFEEVCETLPAGLGARLQASSRARRLFAPLFRKGRHIQTAHLGGFLVLYAVSGLRRWRRGTLRYRLEQAAHRCVARAHQGAGDEAGRLRRRGRARGVSAPGQGIQRYARTRLEELRRHHRRRSAPGRSSGPRGNHQASAHCSPGGRGGQAVASRLERAGTVFRAEPYAAPCLALFRRQPSRSRPRSPRLGGAVSARPRRRIARRDRCSMPAARR